MASKTRTSRQGRKDAGTKAKKKPAVVAKKSTAKKASSASTRAKKVTPAKKVGAASAAAPLLASAPKRVGSASKAGKASASTAGRAKHASYQPKSDVPPIPKPAVHPSAALATPDPLGMTHPWMKLGMQIALANLSMQAHFAKAVMATPPAAMAMRQGTAVLSTWLSLASRSGPMRFVKD